MTEEKRTYDRLVFPKEKEVRALFVSVDDREKEVNAKILNISPGGIGLAAMKDKRNSLKEADELELRGIEGEEELFCLQGQTVKVKWILDHEVFDNYGFGCEFTDLNAECYEKLNVFCESNR